MREENVSEHFLHNDVSSRQENTLCGLLSLFEVEKTQPKATHSLGFADRASAPASFSSYS